VVGRQNADIADTLHLRDVATTFWHSMGCHFIAGTRCLTWLGLNLRMMLVI